MLVSMTALLRLFLYSFLFGISIGLFYVLFHGAASLFGGEGPPLSDSLVSSLPARVRDRVRDKRKSGTKKGASFFLLFLGETAFCLLTAFALSVFFYHFNNGIPRLFSLLAVCFGFWLCQKTVGRLLSRWLSPIRWRLCLLSLYIRAYLLSPLLSHMLFGIRKAKSLLGAVFARLHSAFFAVYAPIRMKRYMKKELSGLLRSPILEELSD